MEAQFDVIELDATAEVHVGPGCIRRDLPSRDGVRVWVVDMAPGAVWPRVDVHDGYGEDILVVRGELIEGDRTIQPGSFVKFAPHSQHRPRTITGVRLFGFNLVSKKEAL